MQTDGFKIPTYFISLISAPPRPLRETKLFHAEETEEQRKQRKLQTDGFKNITFSF